MKRISFAWWKRALSVTLAGALAVTMCPAVGFADTDAAGSESTSEVAAVSDDSAATVGTDGGEAAAAADTSDADEPAKPSKPKPKPKKAVVNFETAFKQGSSWDRDEIGDVMGETVSTKYISALRIYNKCKNIKGSIKYNVYMTGKGWSGWKKDGKTAGKGSAKRALQGIRIKLTGDLEKQYNVYYRVNLVGLGWTGWGKNGEKVGAPKYARIKAYQVKVIKKSKKAQIKKYNSKKMRKHMLYKGSSDFEMGTRMNMAQKAQDQTSNTNWLILVDTNKNRVEILKGEKGAWQVRKYFKCTSGAPGSRTVHGKFTIADRGKNFGEDKGYTCWYWTQFYGNYLFHSVLYNPGSMSSLQDGRLGINASHGCVRLALDNAKWINQNIPRGTKVWSY